MAKRAVVPISYDYIAELDLPIVNEVRGEHLIRIHHSRFDPLWFGPDTTTPPSGRFNAPDHEYGICYSALSFDVAFAETFLQKADVMLLDISDLSRRNVTVLRVKRKLRLVQLHGTGLKRLRLNAAIAHGEHARCRQLALALWSHRARVDGIRYRSCRDNDKYCIAVFDRAGDALVVESSENLVADRARLATTLGSYRVALDQ
ncbi:MAG: RES family NAD+ phosphorylase [bacterium]|nr:RES family NAD+ phosphorylase [Candidatus Kapabacteria bacterium]